MILKIRKRKGDFLIAGIFFFVGMFALIESFRMPPGFYNTPGPGFYPKMLGFLVCGVSMFLGLSSLSRKRDDERVLVGHSDIWSVIAGLIFLGALLERIGFILAFTLFLAFLFKKLSALSLVKCILWASAASLGAYLFFGILLDLRLPPLYFQW